MVVCMDDMATQFVLAMLIIDHLAAVHQCLDACNEILGVLSRPGYYLFEFSKMHMGVDVMCHSCWIRSRKAEAFALVAFCSSLLLVGIHCALHFQGFGSQGCKTYLRWSSLSGRMQLRRSQFSRVW